MRIFTLPKMIGKGFKIRNCENVENNGKIAEKSASRTVKGLIKKYFFLISTFCATNGREKYIRSNFEVKSVFRVSLLTL